MTDMTDRINLSPNSQIPEETSMLCAGDKGNDPSCVIGKPVRLAVSPTLLVGGAAKLEKAAAGWWTVAYSVPTRRLRKVSDGVDDEGKPLAHMELVDEVNVVVRGWRRGGAFLAAWDSSGADCAYWWTREHEAWAELPRERVTWTTPHPTPVKVSFTELKRLLKS